MAIKMAMKIHLWNLWIILKTSHQNDWYDWTVHWSQLLHIIPNIYRTYPKIIGFDSSTLKNSPWDVQPCSSDGIPGWPTTNGQPGTSTCSRICSSMGSSENSLSWSRKTRRMTPCLRTTGEHTKSYWKWPFIVDFPIKHGDFPLLWNHHCHTFEVHSFVPRGSSPRTTHHHPEHEILLGWSTQAWIHYIYIPSGELT